MILYKRGGANFLLKLFQCKGSVFPFALCIALPCSAISIILKYLLDMDYIPFLEGENAIMTENTAWRSFSFLVGFLVVFRTSQAYSRFWDGCTFTHQMRAEWFIAASSIVAFCKHSRGDKNLKVSFQECIVRLFSMLHAVALAEIEDVNADSAIEEIQAFRYELVDVEAIDATSLESIKESDCKVELVFHWIQQLIVENMETGVLDIPAPILARTFQKLAEGMVHFHDAIKISNIPFPFPYAQTCDCLLVLHWVMTPIVVATSATHTMWSGIFSFFSVFILWCLNAIAVEIENPFGMDANDIDAGAMQLELNKHLSLLLDNGTQRTPTFNREASVRLSGGSSTRSGRRNSTFIDAWKAISLQGIGTEEKIHRTARQHRPRRNSHCSVSSRDTECESIATQLETLGTATSSFAMTSAAVATTGEGSTNWKSHLSQISDITIHSTMSASPISLADLTHPQTEGEPSLSESDMSMADASQMMCMPRHLSPQDKEAEYPSEGNRSPASPRCPADKSGKASGAARARPLRDGSHSAAVDREEERDVKEKGEEGGQALAPERSGLNQCIQIGGQGLGGWAPAPITYTRPEG